MPRTQRRVHRRSERHEGEIEGVDAAGRVFEAHARAIGRFRTFAPRWLTAPPLDAPSPL
jgi:hypothetical protein